jgi:TatD DNase family protein
MIELPEFFYNVDVHTHVPADNAIVNITPFGNGDPFMAGCDYYSIGIHPWLVDRVTDSAVERLQLLARDNRIVAIGEAGMDARRGEPLTVQQPVFELQARLADEVQKPLIIHAVATFPQIIGIKQTLRPTVPWIIHGFRGKPQLAQELVRHGFYLSLGKQYNPAVPQVINPEFLLCETDTV